jgi:muramoyltetrapeptide carboxypeptidase
LALRKPFALVPGSTLGIIAPASPVAGPACIEEGIRLLEGLGFRVVLGKYALNKNKYLAGSDPERAADLCAMFLDPRINGVVCLRGGYGSMRLLHRIDYRIIRRNPKVLVGYSDITALQLAIWKKAGLVTFSGPMLAPDFACAGNGTMLKQFYRALTNPRPLGVIPPAPGDRAVVINPGRARGRLLGGNLSLVTATLGTPYEINTRGVILFLEEVNEQPYRIDRMLRQLWLAGKLQAAAGIVFGKFAGCEAADSEESFSLLEVLRETLEGIKVPCFYGLGAGHIALKATLPLGIKAEMDAGNCLLVISESATIQ